MRRPPVEQIVMQSSITGFKLLISEEKRIIQQSQRIENVEALLFGQNERIVHEFV